MLGVEWYPPQYMPTCWNQNVTRFGKGIFAALPGPRSYRQRFPAPTPRTKAPRLHPEALGQPSVTCSRLGDGRQPGQPTATGWGWGGPGHRTNCSRPLQPSWRVQAHRV